MLYSIDGTTWSIIPYFEEWYSSYNIVYWNGIYYTQDNAYYSLDGFNWDRLDIELNNIIYLNNIWYGLGYNGLYESTDGVNFSLLVTTDSNCINLKYLNNTYYLNTSGNYEDEFENNFWVSADKVKWTPSTIGYEESLDTFIQDGKLYIVTSSGLYSLTSIMDFVEN